MTPEKDSNTFKIKHLPSLIVDTFKAWDADNPFRLSAVVAYYAVLSLPGLLVIIINLVGSVWGVEIVQGQLTDEISSALGRDAADSIQSMILETQNKDKSTIATVLGIGTLIFGATGVFYHLQQSLNKIWSITSNNKISFIKIVLDRARSFAFILVVGFLLLVSFLITTGISALNNYIKSILPDIIVYIAFTLDILVSVGIITI